MKRKVGIFAECLGKDFHAKDRLELIKSAGFEVVASELHAPDLIAQMKDEADRLGLFFEEIHAPFSGINNMWIEGSDYLTVYNAVKNKLPSAAKKGEPK